MPLRTAALLALSIAALPAMATPAAAPAPADDLGWLAGHWCGGSGGERIEESWLAPRGGLLLGLSRTVQGERLAGFEFLRIQAVDGVPNYLAQPGGRAPTAFARSAGGEHWVRFENPAHDFPRRIEYRRNGDTLRAEIAGPGEDGKEFVIGVDYRACAD